VQAAVGEAAQPAAAAVQQVEREADHDRRQRERQVDDRVQQAAARKRVRTSISARMIPTIVFAGTAIASASASASAQ
jgi:hypothetical protein